MTNFIHIDNLAFAKKNEKIAEVMSITHFNRLAELLGHDDLALLNKNADTVKFTLTGVSKGLSQYYLLLNIDAHLTALCQRCLKPAPLDISLNFNYLLSDIDAHAVEELDDVDLLQIEQAMDVLGLIEDELITALPIAPTHAEGCELKHNISGEKPNPFAVLKNLIK